MHRAVERLLLPVLLMGCLVPAVGVRGDSNVTTGKSHAWSGNVGWLDWRPTAAHGVEIDQFICTGYIYAANVGWISMGSGLPANGMNYQNNSATDYGVNVDSQGNLRGFAYGANIGWISFSPAGHPSIDMTTGRLSGFAYGANTGWLALGNMTFQLQIDHLGAGVDEDLDGIPDAWEIAHTGSLAPLSANGDRDGDGHSDLEEYYADTDPLDPADNLRILAVSRSSDGAALTLTWSTRSTRRYIVESREGFEFPDLWTDVGWGSLTANGPALSHEVPLVRTEPSRYFRLRAVRPLAR